MPWLARSFSFPPYPAALAHFQSEIQASAPCQRQALCLHTGGWARGSAKLLTRGDANPPACQDSLPSTLYGRGGTLRSIRGNCTSCLKLQHLWGLPAMFAFILSLGPWILCCVTLWKSPLQLRLHHNHDLGTYQQPLRLFRPLKYFCLNRRKRGQSSWCRLVFREMSF